MPGIAHTICTLQAYLSHLASQRDASSRLMRLELLRQKLLLSEISPGAALTALHSAVD
jgi:hypothetical protein